MWTLFSIISPRHIHGRRTDKHIRANSSFATPTISRMVLNSMASVIMLSGVRTTASVPSAYSPLGTKKDFSTFGGENRPDWTPSRGHGAWADMHQERRPTPKHEETIRVQRALKRPEGQVVEQTVRPSPLRGKRCLKHVLDEARLRALLHRPGGERRSPMVRQGCADLINRAVHRECVPSQMAPHTRRRCARRYPADFGAFLRLAQLRLADRRRELRQPPMHEASSHHASKSRRVASRGRQGHL